jgi:hypothetical protein
MEPIQDLNEKKIGAVSEYAPKAGAVEYKDRDRLAQLEKAITPYSYNRTEEPINEIKAKLKLLTHRQMRDMCKAICNGKDIPAAELPDVLDKFAYGD